MLLSFFSYYPAILQITLLVANDKNMSSMFRVISNLIAVARKHPGFETSQCIKAEYLLELK